MSDKKQEEVDVLFQEWAFKWLSSRRLTSLPLWQKNILDTSFKGERPDTYLSMEMNSFNRAVMSLQPIDFAAFIYSALSMSNKQHPPAKTFAYYVGASRETLLNHIPKARALVANRYKDSVQHFIQMREEFGVKIIDY